MKSIQQTRADVDAKHPADKTNANNQTIVENTDSKGGGAFNNGLGNGTLLLAGRLKELISFRELLEADGHRFHGNGRSGKCCCPFHPDRTPSFFVNEEDTHGKCYGCDWWGNIFDYEMKWNKTDFKTAWARLIDFHYKHARRGRKAGIKKEKSKAAAVDLSPRQQEERRKYSDRLAKDYWIASEICNKRKGGGEKWKPETIQALGAEGTLGWAGDCLAFIYPTGTKYRKWPEKDFYWECEGISLWRDHLLVNAEHVYLTESETDAIALLDSNVEAIPGNAVIAVPSATSFIPNWAPRFKGKIVTLCFDNDDAGENGVKKVAPLLTPYAAELYTVDLKGVE